MVALALALLIGATPGPSGGAENDGERFKRHVTAGERLYASGDYGAAIFHFKRADQVRVTPEMAFNLARSHQRLGENAQAAYYYRLYLRRAPNASDALEVAELLADLLSQAEANGRGLLEVEASAQGQVTLDERTYPELPVAAFLPPGDYTVQAHFPGRTLERTVSIRTGKTTSVAFEVAPTPPADLALLEAPPPPMVSVPAPADAPPSPSRERTLRTTSLVVLGASAAALLSGSVLGLMSRQDASRAREDKKQLTVSEANALADRANGRGTTANVLFIAGGAGALAGGVLFAFSLPEPGMGSGGGW